MQARKRRFDSTRRSRKRKPASRIFVACEGQTERAYFRYLNTELRTSGIQIKPYSDKSDPSEVVEEAIKANRGDLHKGVDEGYYDEVWAVFDWDGRTEQVRKAKHLAKKNRVHVALSNPAFELWLVWHFLDYMNPSCDQKETLKELQKVWPNYKKGMDIDFTTLPPHSCNDARSRSQNARKAHKQHRCYFPNNRPSTDIDLLIEYLISAWKDWHGNSSICPIL
ncbi:RloB domain-containing protein [Bifidobacterium sp. B4001]|uniref:RloB family protein n=1 Tax=Bifidobacterium TaxID=1678 RepID=UPI001C6A6998|nr:MULTISPECIES: RloB family protein [Bifidobacterium]MCX8648656.1 RloB domain-containing protein [Bifidobacterium sp. B4107]MCX8652192.1 RloB domain-containing protein [Bifidobacterium sp. B4111]MCX8658623.1 RloB domain-containing protein [Bifidobacterium sp. B4114]MCX8673561.1 RloB domain-containing protein [Bifidobacterium sp. B4079]MCX8682042.1 RloB domain-containing protein [Bifidobacterium sp. B4001]